MRKEKLKNDSSWRAGMLPFVGLWASTYAIAWFGVLYFIELLDDLGDFSRQEIDNFAIAFIMIVASLLQVQVVERLLKKSMRGWMLVTLLGTLITFFTFRDSSLSGSDQLTMLITSLSLLVPVPLVQTAWLWRRVKSAWLWPLASLMAAIAFIVPLRSGSGAGELVLFSAALYGLIQGGIMRYLWTQEKEDEKAKVDFDIDQHASHDERASRVQEVGAPPVTWHTRDEAAAQHKAQ